MDIATTRTGPPVSGSLGLPVTAGSGDGGVLCARVLPVTLTISGILWLGPYWVWDTPLYFRLSVALVAATFAATLCLSGLLFRARNILLALLLLALFLYFGAHRNGGPFVLSTGWLVLIVFVLSDDRVKGTTLRYFTTVFTLSLVPGLVVLVCSVLGLELPWHAITAKRFDFDLLLGNEPGYYRGYLGSVVLNDQVFRIGPSTVFRLSGMYDEPGVVGTFSALLLAANGMRIRRSMSNAVLLIGGLLSFSMAFYAIVFVYLLLRRPLATLAASVGAAVVLFSSSLADNPLVNLFFLSRFTAGGGTLLADNRVTPLFTVLYEEFWRADLATRLFGSAHDVTILVNTGNFSYKVLVYAYGLVGVAALALFLVVATTSISRSRAVLTLLFVFLLSIYQRPDVLMLPYLLVLLGGAVHLQQVDATHRSTEFLPGESGGALA